MLSCHNDRNLLLPRVQKMITYAVCDTMNFSSMPFPFLSFDRSRTVNTRPHCALKPMSSCRCPLPPTISSYYQDQQTPPHGCAPSETDSPPSAGVGRGLNCSMDHRQRHQPHSVRSHISENQHKQPNTKLQEYHPIYKVLHINIISVSKKCL
jgi:hypothetical protein